MKPTLPILLSARLVAACLPVSALAVAGVLTTARPAAAQDGASSAIAGVKLPRGASRLTDKGLTAGFGRMMNDGAKEWKIPERQGGPGEAEVYSWTGASYKPGRAKFMMTMLQSALTEAGYTYTGVDGSYENTPNVFMEEEYGTGPLSISPADPRPQFFKATNVQAGKTIIGVWLDQESKGRVVLAIGQVGFAGAPVVTKAPEITDPNVWLVKDLKNATAGMPGPSAPTFPKLAPKPGFVRGMVKDGSGKPIAGAHIVAWASAAGGFRTSVDGKTNAQGIYEIPLPVGICQVVNADVNVTFGAKRMNLPLHPADGERDQFNSKQGHVENFVLRTSGSATETSGDPGASYGAPMRILTWHLPDKALVEVTLKPNGPLADGSTGKTLVFRWKGPAAGLGGETFLGGIPLGRYTLTAKVYDGEDALPLRAKNTFSNEGSTPELSASLPVVFESEGTQMASLGRSGVKRYEVTLEP